MKGCPFGKILKKVKTPDDIDAVAEELENFCRARIASTRGGGHVAKRGSLGLEVLEILPSLMTLLLRDEKLLTEPDS